MASETSAMYGQRINFSIKDTPFGRTAMRAISITDTIKMPFKEPIMPPETRTVLRDGSVLIKCQTMISKTMSIAM